MEMLLLTGMRHGTEALVVRGCVLPNRQRSV